MALSLGIDKKLNPQQKKAVQFGSGPLLIIAGAGTGKTTVITERIKYLISKKLAKPQEILALTFTEKASREMEERVDHILPYGVTQMWISTFHAFCDRILRSEALSIGLTPNYTLMTEAETIQFFKSHLFDFDLSYYRPLGNPGKFISGILQHFSRLKDEDVDSEQYLRYVQKVKSHPPAGRTKSKSFKEMGFEEYEELAKAYRTYEELKVKEGVADYGDLIANTLKLFRTRPSILRRYQEMFKYICIDEFQDTNYAQNELAILLAGKKQNITVVGDDDQAIYRWRGAAVSNILQFRKKFPKTKIVVLTKNYRSTKTILDASYNLIQHNNPDRLEVIEHIEKKLECERRIHGTPVVFHHADRVENEAEYVAKTIVELEKRENNFSFKDFAILVRANAHAEPFVRALTRHGVPFQFLGPGQLYKQPEVKDLISYLRVLYDIHDSTALFRVLSMDYFAIPPRDIAELLSLARANGLSLFEACESLTLDKRTFVGDENFDAPSVAGHQTTSTVSQRASEVAQNFITSSYALNKSKIRISNDGVKKISFLVSLITKHLAVVKKDSAGQILYYFLEQTGLLKNLTSVKSEKDERVAEHIAKFFDRLKTYEGDHEDASVFAVVDFLNLAMEVGESPLASDSDWTRVNAVNILTVHSAKGLEFPVVCLVNLVSERFPTRDRKEQIPIPDALIKEILPIGDYHLEEERRLFYVGVTRAKDYLYLTSADYYGEGKREKKISPFVSETIGEEQLEKGKEVQTQKKAQLSLLEWAHVPEKIHTDREKQQELTYLSYSQYETFHTCPLQYKYRYILHIPVSPSAALVFGDTMHRTMKAFYEMVRKNEPVTKSVLLSLFDTVWKKTGYRNKAYEEKMRDHGKELLRDFFDKGFDRTVAVLGLEQPFKLKITKTLSLGGKIDRVDKLKNGKIEIIDYKTGSAPKKKDVSDDFQLTMYALAATDKGLYGKKAEDVIVSFYFFDGQEKLSSTRSNSQLEKAKQDIKETAGYISTTDFSPTPGRHCDFCEFRLICEAWK